MPSKPLRLAILRVDTHAYWYAPMMVDCDPLQFRQNNPVCHHFFCNMYRPTQWTIDRPGGFKLINVWDYDRTAAQTFAKTFPDNPRVCSRVEDATEGVDAAMIACCDLAGSDHLKLAAPFLRKGIPLSIDKPFANSVENTRKMLSLARRYHAPLFSASLLSYTDQVPQLLRRSDELGPMRFGIVKGSNGWLTKSGLEGVTHGVAMALATFGFGVQSVEATGDLPCEFMTLRWRDGRKMLVINSDGAHYGGRFSVEVWGKRDPIQNMPLTNTLQSQGVGDPEFPSAGARIVRLFARMARNRKRVVPESQLLEWVAISQAAALSQKRRRPIQLTELLRR